MVNGVWQKGYVIYELPLRDSEWKKILNKLLNLKSYFILFKIFLNVLKYLENWVIPQGVDHSLIVDQPKFVTLKVCVRFSLLFL